MVELREDIKAAKPNWFLALGANREIRRLINYIGAREQVIKMNTGNYGGGRGLIVLTDRRVLFVKDGFFAKKTQDFPFHTVSSVEWSSRIFFGDIILFADGAEARIEGISAFSGGKIASAIRDQSGRRDSLNNQFSQQNVPEPTVYRAPAVTPPVRPARPELVSAPAEDALSVAEKDKFLNDMERLEKLYRAGILNADDFEAAKKRLLR